MQKKNRHVLLKFVKNEKSRPRSFGSFHNSKAQVYVILIILHFTYLYYILLISNWLCQCILF